MNEKVRVDFVCVHNTGRSQMAEAFAERELSKRNLEETVEVYSGGTDPADEIQQKVIEAMSEVGIDLSDKSPGYVAELEDLKQTDYMVTMGCTIARFSPEQYGVESHDWDLASPDGQDMETVREVRDEIETRVKDMFEEIEALAEERQASSGGIVAQIRETLSI